MGVVECVKHQLLEPFNVLWEKEGQLRKCSLFLSIHRPYVPLGTKRKGEGEGF